MVRTLEQSGQARLGTRPASLRFSVYTKQIIDNTVVQFPACPIPFTKNPTWQTRTGIFPSPFQACSDIHTAGGAWDGAMVGLYEPGHKSQGVTPLVKGVICLLRAIV